VETKSPPSGTLTCLRGFFRPGHIVHRLSPADLLAAIDRDLGP
jgi:hypothetical protein